MPKRSRSPNRWYSGTVDMIKAYKELEGAETAYEQLFKESIDQTIAELLTEKDGPDIIRSVEMLYIHKTHTIEGVALHMSVSERTIRRWKTRFIEKVFSIMNDKLAKKDTQKK